MFFFYVQQGWQRDLRSRPPPGDGLDIMLYFAIYIFKKKRATRKEPP